MDLHWYGYVMYFEDIQAPRSQFKRRDKFGLTRILPTNTECKKCHQQEWKNYSTPSELKMITCVTRSLWKIAWRGSRVIYSNYHTHNMTPSYRSHLGTNCRLQPFNKYEEYWTFSYLLVFKSCYEGEMQSLASWGKNGHWKVTLKNPGLAFKTHFVEVSFVIMIPTSCYVHFY